MKSLLREVSRREQEAIARASNRLREWLERRLDDDSLDIARLYRSDRDRLLFRLRTVYDEFLRNDPSLLRARLTGAGSALDAAIVEEISRLGSELSSATVEKLTDTLQMQPRAVRRHLARWRDVPFRELPPSAQDVLNELTTGVVGGGTFFDHLFHVTDDLRSKIVSSVRSSLLNGDDFDVVRDRMLRAFGVDRLDEPSAAAYGSVKVYKNEARRQWNLLMADVAEEAGATEVWWAILDQRTTPGCAARHGTVIRGEYPPRHMNCRCTVAIFDPDTDLAEFLEEGDAWLQRRGYTRRRAAHMEAVGFPWGRHTLRPLALVDDETLRATRGVYRAVTREQLAQLAALVPVDGEWYVSPLYALAASVPDAVLLKTEDARRPFDGLRVLSRDGWVPLTPNRADASEVWIETHRGWVLDSPDIGPAWERTTRRLPVDLIDRWPKMAGLTFPTGERYAVGVLDRDDAQRFALGLFGESKWVVGNDLGSLVRQEVNRALPSDPFLAVATVESSRQVEPGTPPRVRVQPDDLRSIVSLATGAVAYARDEFPSDFISPYRRVAVVAMERDHMIWAIRPRGEPFWALPGGRIKDDETPRAAAVREMLEETGVTVGLVLPLGRIYRPWSTTDVFLARRLSDPETPKYLDEIDAVAKISVDELEPTDRLWLLSRWDAVRGSRILAEGVTKWGRSVSYPQVVTAFVEEEFDPAEHPRHPKGSPEGGQFAPKGGAAAPTWQPKSKDDQATQEKLDREWGTGQEHLRQLLDTLVKKGVPVAADAEDWDSLPSDLQSQVEEEFLKDEERQQLEMLEQNWAEDSLPENVSEEMADDPEWREEIVKKFLDDYTFDDGREIDIVPESLVRAAAFDGGVVRVDPTKLRWYRDEKQELLFPERKKEILQQRWSSLDADFKEFFRLGFDSEFERRIVAARDDPPDFTHEARVYANEVWEGMTEAEKFRLAKRLGVLGGFEAPLSLPGTYKLLRNGPDYTKTAAVGRVLQEARTAELLRERKIESPSTKGVRGMIGSIWEAWKDSSTSGLGKALQLAAAMELGARDRFTREEASEIERRVETLGYSFDAVKAYTRAAWETTQFLMEQAGVDELDVYRAVMLPGAELKGQREERVSVQGEPEYSELPDIRLLRNGASSWTMKSRVANTWDGVGPTPENPERVVLRAKVPRTAVISLPVYGQNIHEEEEVVVIGTPWKKWDAWRDRAPLFKLHPIREAFRLEDFAAEKPPVKGMLVIDFNVLEAGKPHWLSASRQRAIPVVQSEAFDPAEHPRHPEGSPEGGRFAPKDGGQDARDRRDRDDERRDDEDVSTHYAGWSPSWREPTADEFIELRNRSTRVGYLSPLTPQDLSDHRFYVSQDGKVGFALDPDGDVQNVFNNGGPKGAGAEALFRAIELGGRTLDCFDGHLPDLYTQFGFAEVGRMRFNREYAPKGWDFERDGEPDVVFMAWKGFPDAKSKVRTEVLGPKDRWRSGQRAERYYDDWDQAKADSRRAGVDRPGREAERARLGRAARPFDFGAGPSDRHVVVPVVQSEAFDPAEHPRAPKGSPTGGQFVKKGAGAPTQPTPAEISPPTKRDEPDRADRKKRTKGAIPEHPLKAREEAPTFDTSEDAEAWMRKQYPDKAVSFKGAKPETFNPTIREFHRLAQEYPDVAAQIKYIGTGEIDSPEHQKQFAETWERHPHAWAVAGAPYSDIAGRIGGGFITLNPKVYNDPIRFKVELEHSRNTGWHPPEGDTIESVLTHEFGHHVLYFLLNRDKKAVVPLSPATGFGVMDETLNEWRVVAEQPLRQTSGYAKTSTVEAFAEAFVLYEATRRRGLPVTPGTGTEHMRRLLTSDLMNPSLDREPEYMSSDLTPTEQIGAYTKLRRLARQLGLKTIAKDFGQRIRFWRQRPDR